MLEQITQSFHGVLSRFRGPRKLSEAEIDEAVREARRGLLAADVHFQVAKELTAGVAEQLKGDALLPGVSGADQALHAFQQQMIAVMTGEGGALPSHPRHPMVLLLAGLQGAGKTTTAAKLALWLRQRKSAKVLMAACDLRRPAAVQQLQRLGEQLQVSVYAEKIGPETTPEGVAERALKEAHKGGFDALIVDTGGRLHVDQELMEEVSRIAASVKPDATYLALDAMTGQDAVQSAAAFAEKLDLYGLILTKMDGDARGGAALSVRSVTGCPVRFLGTGETASDLEEFEAERFASRILDLGDLTGLVEAAQEAVTEKDTLGRYQQMMSGKFSLEDLLQQFQTLRKMGSMKKLLGMMPGAGRMSGLLEQLDDREFSRVEAIVRSMTPEERIHPEILDGRRKRRVAAGSGRQVSDVNQLLRSFKEMQKQMKSLGQKFGGRGSKRLLRQMSKSGRLPNFPGGFPRR